MNIILKRKDRDMKIVDVKKYIVDNQICHIRYIDGREERYDKVWMVMIEKAGKK